MSTAAQSTIRVSANQVRGVSSGKGWLVQLYPLDLERTRIKVFGPRVVLGRDEQCEICFDDHSISR